MFTWLWLLLALILFGFAGLFGTSDLPDCGADGCGPIGREEWTPVTINGHEGVILPESAAPDLLMYTGLEPEGYWVPGEAELQLAEDAIARHASRAPFMGEAMLEGRRQYAGFIQGGERKVYVNSFCAEFPDWRSNVVFVVDGGACFWQAVYNVDTGEVDRITINGDA